MRLRFFAYACLFGILCGLPACDTGTPLTLIDDGDQVFVPDDTALPPVLTRVETPGSEGDPVCPGDVITMGGINFDRDLERNEVFFTAGNRRAKGLPLLVRLQPAEDGVNLTSFLDVVVPGGVSRGNVELVVRGQSAGAAGLDVCPLIVGFTMGLNEDAAVLPYNLPGNPPGFIDGASRLTVYGLSFTDVQEAILSDDSGNTRRVPANTFVRNPTAPAQGVEPTGLDSVAFNLRDEANDVRLPFSDERSNIGIFLRSARAESNRLEAPVSTGDIPEEIGLVITSVKVPVGVVTGPVRIHYTCYEFAVDAEWKIEVQFRASNDQFTSDWLNAKPIEDDSKIDGTPNLDEVLVTNLLAGSPRHRSGHRLLPGIGVMRTFVWDAPNDPIFRALNNERDSSGMSRARNWKVQFRLTPIPDTENRSFYTKTHRAETPPIVYYDLVDRPSGDVELSRVAEFVEAFQDKQLEDRRASSAFWGPPINPGLLTGSTETDILDPFGEGNAVLDLANIDPTVFLEPGEMILDEFIEFNTDRMEVVHRIFTDAGTPGDEGDDVPIEFIEAYIDHEGNRVLNPGEEINEFHLAVLRIRPGTRVLGTGSQPLIIRLSGKTEDEQFLDDGVALHLEPDAWIDLDGVDGGNSEGPGCPLPPNCGDRNGSGGRPGSGGGKGGDGATCTIFATTRYVRNLTAAEPGDNEGGGGGATPTALDFDAMRMLSIFHGAPGGGGGHATTGQDGVYSNTGRPAIAQYETPRVGEGGAVRGDATQVLLTAGSGGGAGGASVSRAMGCIGPYYTTAGAGGGGAGGALRIVARGRVVVDGLISANGGNGGSGEIPHSPDPQCDYPHRQNQIATGGAGGGGSGGSIVIQALRSIELATCETLQVQGGVGGESARGGNQKAGDGGEGYIRLESAGDALAFCGEVPADPGVVSDGGLTTSPDEISFGRGQDGTRHLNFLVSINPITNAPIIDPATGRQVSIWTFDTDEGLLVSPIGEEFRTRLPDVMDLNRLIIDEDVLLRVSGSKALTISCRDSADIAGTIDCSGFPGGLLTIDAPGTHPLPGDGGRGGPGGGNGGAGGAIRHADGDATNRDPTNTISFPGERGGAPPGLEAFDRNGLLQPAVGAVLQLVPLFSTATPGGSLPGRGGACDSNCQLELNTTSAGGGAGGGNLGGGADGDALLPAGRDPAEAELRKGRGGSPVGLANLRYHDGVFRGGSGGSGGGASSHVSAPYSNRRIPGRFPFRGGTALFAPGTGGGGGGGVLILKATSLHLWPTARLLARGGDAFQSIDLAGNGGGGGGGSVLLQVTHSIIVDSGSLIDVRGGLANRLPPLTLEGLRVYEGNIREEALGTPPAEEGAAFGGLGGNGGAGRVRLESPADSPLISLGANPEITTGFFLVDAVESLGISLPVRIGLAPGFVASNHEMEFGPARLLFSPLQPPGTAVEVFWQGARESLDIHGGVGEFEQLVRDPRLLREREFVRFMSVFRSNRLTRNSQALSEIKLPYGFTP